MYHFVVNRCEKKKNQRSGRDSVMNTPLVPSFTSSYFRISSLLAELSPSPPFFPLNPLSHLFPPLLPPPPQNLPFRSISPFSSPFKPWFLSAIHPLLYPYASFSFVPWNILSLFLPLSLFLIAPSFFFLVPFIFFFYSPVFPF